MICIVIVFENFFDNIEFNKKEIKGMKEMLGGI